MNERKIVLMRGIQGSGKTTLALSWCNESPETRVRWNNDDFRRMLGPYWVPSRESFISKVFWDFLSDAMSSGKDIVIDNMNLNPKTVKEIEDFVEEFNSGYTPVSSQYHYTIGFHDCFLPVEECIERDKHRSNPIGESVIKQTWRKYRSVILKIENERLARSLNNDNDKIHARAIIVDVDATISLNTSGRPFYGDGCAEGIKDDMPIKPVISIVNNYKTASSFHSVIILTGREDTPEIRKATEEWLNRNGVKFDKLLMRPSGTYNSGDECKKLIYLNLIKPYYNIDFVLDDSLKCVKMWRSLNLLCLQPNEGKY